jgi:HD-like signal output (HDOD) protein
VITSFFGVLLLFTFLAGWLILRRVHADNTQAVGQIGPSGRLGCENRDRKQEKRLAIVAEDSETIPTKIEQLADQSLKKLVPFNRLKDEDRIAFSRDRTAERYHAGALLFSRGEAIDALLYLLEGKISVELDRDKTYQIAAGTAKARYPLCMGEKHSGTARALTETVVLRVSRDLLDKCRFAEDGSKSSLDLGKLPIPETLADSQLFHVFCRSFDDGQVHLPPLPPVAMRLKQALQHDIDIGEAVKIVQLDPVIATKLISLSNSPLYLAPNRANTCQSAIIRLGLLATRNLILSISVKQMFRCKNLRIAQIMNDIWRQSVYRSVLCFVLASKTGAIDPDKALLAGLISNIGAIPFLHFAEKLPADHYSPAEINAAIPVVSGPVGSYLLERWDFPADYVGIPCLAEEWFHDHGDGLDLGDLVRLAVWHSFIGTPKMGELPPISVLPAYLKLKNGALSPELSLGVLHDAKALIADAYTVLAF